MKTIPYFEQVAEVLSPLNPRPMKTYRGKDISDLENIKVEIMEQKMRCFEADKLDRIVLLKNDIADGSFVVWVIAIVPNDEYPLPTFFSEILHRMSDIKVRADFYPQADCVQDWDYFEKFMMPMEPVWEKHKDLEGAGMERLAWARVLGSPFHAFGKFPVNDTIKKTAVDITIDYLKLYVKLWQETEKADRTYMAALNKRKELILQRFSEKDPARGPLEKTLGKEKSDRLMELLF